MKKQTIAAFVISLAVGVVIAQHGNTGPGYTWGLQHCGPASGVQSQLACKTCCRGAYNSGTIGFNELSQCRDFCEDANWPTRIRRLLGNFIPSFVGGGGSIVR